MGFGRLVWADPAGPSPLSSSAPLILNSVFVSSTMKHDDMVCTALLCRTVNGADMKLEHGNKMVKAADQGPTRCQIPPLTTLHPKFRTLSPKIMSVEHSHE